MSRVIQISDNGLQQLSGISIRLLGDVTVLAEKEVLKSGCNMCSFRNYIYASFKGRVNVYLSNRSRGEVRRDKHFQST